MGIIGTGADIGVGAIVGCATAVASVAIALGLVVMCNHVASSLGSVGTPFNLKVAVIFTVIGALVGGYTGYLGLELWATVVSVVCALFLVGGIGTIGQRLPR